MRNDDNSDDILIRKWIEENDKKKMKSTLLKTK